MKIIEPKIELIWMTENPLQMIEKSARTCYKSEHNIKDGSAEKIVKKLIELNHTAMLEHASASYRVTTDRGVSHEIVRHRIGCSYAQESTRYINYKGKDIEFIKPSFWESDNPLFEYWKISCGIAEKSYNELINEGATPQEARSILPNSLKTEIIMTLTFRAWLHFFKLRTSSDAHPDIRQVAIMLQKDLQQKVPVVFQ
jgi:thymidylate synthase (FAD)